LWIDPLGTRGFPKKSFFNKKKGPHPAQHHDSNSAFRRLIAAYFSKEKRLTHEVPTRRSATTATARSAG